METYTHCSICRDDLITTRRDQALQPVVPAGSTSSFPQKHSRKSIGRHAAEEHRPRIRLRQMEQLLDAENKEPQRRHPSERINCPITTSRSVSRASLRGLQIDLRSLRSLLPRALPVTVRMAAQSSETPVRTPPAGSSGIPRIAAMP